MSVFHTPVFYRKMECPKCCDHHHRHHRMLLYIGKCHCARWFGIYHVFCRGMMRWVGVGAYSNFCRLSSLTVLCFEPHASSCAFANIENSGAKRSCAFLHCGENRHGNIFHIGEFALSSCVPHSKR